MYSGLLIILLPLVIGYLLPLKSPGLQRLLNRLLSWMVYIILFFMGISLAFLDNLAANLLAIVHIASVSVIAILACNLIALRLLEKRRPWRHQHHQEALPSRLHMALESLKLLGVVVLACCSAYPTGRFCIMRPRRANTPCYCFCSWWVCNCAAAA